MTSISDLDLVRSPSCGNSCTGDANWDPMHGGIFNTNVYIAKKIVRRFKLPRHRTAKSSVFAKFCTAYRDNTCISPTRHNTAILVTGTASPDTRANGVRDDDANCFKFGRLKMTLKTIGLSKCFVAQTCQVVAAILHLDNIEFTID
ncbi:hypothetical protein V8E55_009574 [Tylopilus felleus]